MISSPTPRPSARRERGGAERDGRHAGRIPEQGCAAPDGSVGGHMFSSLRRGETAARRRETIRQVAGLEQ
jgi:hypothetical protein